MRLALTIFAISLMGGASGFAQPKNVPASNIALEAREIRETLNLLGLQKEFIVSGQTAVDSYFVGAERIIFKSGAELIFSQTALRQRNNLLIAARTIVMEDPSKPGVITWARGNGPAESAPQSGQAPGGPHGNSDGAAGGPGSSGMLGNTGISGQNAPNLTFFVLSFQGAPPIADIRGQPGGVGGSGQRGGDGGVGQRGSPASSSLFDCKSGAGYGGTGGPGGNGGKGGLGGRGGSGGTVTFVSLPEVFPALLQLVRADIGGGPGGDGGLGGASGVGGPGGPQGAPSLPYCKDEPGRRGAAGPAGQAGGKGEQGTAGVTGDVLYTTLSPDAFDRILGGP